MTTDRTKAARELLAFYREAGVDAVLGEAPVDRFADEGAALHPPLEGEGGGGPGGRPRAGPPPPRGGGGGGRPPPARGGVNLIDRPAHPHPASFARRPPIRSGAGSPPSRGR